MDGHAVIAHRPFILEAEKAFGLSLFARKGWILIITILNHIEKKMQEIWKPITDYENLYEVSNIGRVKSLNYNHTGEEKLLKQKTNKKNGYHTVVLYKYGKTEYPSVHRLVAQAFIPNPDNLPQVNHKDENTENNCVDNLEWCTAKYNLEYNNGQKRRACSRTNGKLSKQIAQYTFDLPCELIKVWPSISEIERQTGYSKSNIFYCCNGKYKQAYGYQWAYWEE